MPDAVKGKGWVILWGLHPLKLLSFITMDNVGVSTGFKILLVDNHILSYYICQKKNDKMMYSYIIIKAIYEERRFNNGLNSQFF